MSRSDVNHWTDLHEYFVSEAKDKEADVVFIGDDHMALMEQSTFFRKSIAPLHCLVFGILGDRLENVRWRIENGELSNITPKVIVLSVGVNDCGDPSAFLTSLTSLVELVTEKQPTSELFVLRLLPCGKLQSNEKRCFVEAVNGRLEESLNGKATVIDVEPTLISTDGHIDPHIMFDFVHLTQEGYARVLEPVQVAVSSALNP